MKILQRLSFINVVGLLWDPDCGVCSYRYDLEQSDIDRIKELGKLNVQDIGQITREAVDSWLHENANAGDFRRIWDFSASVENGEDTIDIPWVTNEGEAIWIQCNFDGD